MGADGSGCGECRDEMMQPQIEKIQTSIATEERRQVFAFHEAGGDAKLPRPEAQLDRKIGRASCRERG